MRSMVMRAVLSKADGRFAETTAGHRQAALMRIFICAATTDPLVSADAAGSFFLVSLFGQHGL
jgi:hypothetical protein